MGQRRLGGLREEAGRGWKSKGNGAEPLGPVAHRLGESGVCIEPVPEAQCIRDRPHAIAGEGDRNHDLLDPAGREHPIEAQRTRGEAERVLHRLVRREPAECEPIEDRTLIEGRRAESARLTQRDHNLLVVHSNPAVAIGQPMDRTHAADVGIALPRRRDLKGAHRDEECGRHRGVAPILQTIPRIEHPAPESAGREGGGRKDQTGPGSGDGRDRQLTLLQTRGRRQLGPAEQTIVDEQERLERPAGAFARSGSDLDQAILVEQGRNPPVGDIHRRPVGLLAIEPTRIAPARRALGHMMEELVGRARKGIGLKLDRSECRIDAVGPRIERKPQKARGCVR